MLLLFLCLTLLQKAINLGQACSKDCLHHGGKELGVPADFLLLSFMRTYIWYRPGFTAGGGSSTNLVRI